MQAHLESRPGKPYVKLSDLSLAPPLSVNASLLAEDSANVILLRLRLQGDGEDGKPLSGS